MAISFKKQKEVIEKEIKPQLEKELTKKFDEIRNQGILIGWNSFAIQAIKNIKKMNSIDEIKSYFQSEADKTAKKLNIDMNEFE